MTGRLIDNADIYGDFCFRVKVVVDKVTRKCRVAAK